MPASLVLTVPVAAPVAATWAAVTAWDRQGEWMLGTHVTAAGGNTVGGTLTAFTGVGRIGFVDTMTITRWDPPYRCEVLHTGRVVRGSGIFEVRQAALGSELVWTEVLVLPFGALGRLGWPVVRPLFAAGVRWSLRRFARWVEDGTSRATS